MLTKTKAYVAADGAVFTDRAQAMVYSHRLKLRELAEKLVDEAANGANKEDSVDAVYLHLLKNADGTIKLLTKATRKPKEKPSSDEDGKDGGDA